MKSRLTATRMILPAMVLAIGTPASAHRLDEYLQATTISLEQGHIQAQMRLTPGVAVFPAVFATMDTNGNGVLSAAEQRAYAGRVTGDLSLALDGKPIQLKLTSWKFAKTGEMKQGRGDIEIEFNADAPHGGLKRQLIFENHHQPRHAVYLVNCLVPNDPNIHVTAQKRNYFQSRYELDYAQVYAPVSRGASAGQGGVKTWAGAVLLLLVASFAWLWRYIGMEKDAREQKSSVSPDTVTSS